MVNAVIRNPGLPLTRMLLVIAALSAPLTAAADTVMITGANSGIGLEFAKEYAAQGWTVIATHRRAEPPKTLTDLAARYPKVRIETLDVTNLGEAKQLATKLAGVPIDVLINNAGVYNDRAKCAGTTKAVPATTAARLSATSSTHCSTR